MIKPLLATLVLLPVLHDPPQTHPCYLPLPPPSELSEEDRARYLKIQEAIARINKLIWRYRYLGEDFTLPSPVDGETVVFDDPESVELLISANPHYTGEWPCESGWPEQGETLRK